MKMHSIYTFLLLSLMVSGCAHSVHQYTASDYSPKINNRTRKITAESEQHVILWVASNTNYVEEAVRRLENKCPDGEISGIQARYSTSLGFLSWTNKIYLHGHCL